MTLRGKVQGGVIVLEGGEYLSEGLFVDIYADMGGEIDFPVAEIEGEGKTLAERYAAFIGHAADLPPDLSSNHDHYLYGCPKK